MPCDCWLWSATEVRNPASVLPAQGGNSARASSPTASPTRCFFHRVHTGLGCAHAGCLCRTARLWTTKPAALWPKTAAMSVRPRGLLSPHPLSFCVLFRAKCLPFCFSAGHKMSQIAGAACSVAFGKGFLSAPLFPFFLRAAERLNLSGCKSISNATCEVCKQAQRARPHPALHANFPPHHPVRSRQSGCKADVAKIVMCIFT